TRISFIRTVDLGRFKSQVSNCCGGDGGSIFVLGGGAGSLANENVSFCFGIEILPCLIWVYGCDLFVEFEPLVCTQIYDNVDAFGVGAGFLIVGASSCAQFL